MAKKDNIGLLNEIVGQLRTLNRSSVRDQLRENEALKRSETLMGQGEVAEEQQSNIIDSGQDFQRRFLAGQAKTFTDRKTQATSSKLAPQDLTNKRLASLLRYNFTMMSDIAKLAGHGTKPGSLFVHDLSVEKGIGEVLKQDLLSINEFEKLGDTVGDELSKAAHISRGGVGYLSESGRSNVNEGEFIKLAARARKAQLENADDEHDIAEMLQDSARLGNLEDFMQSSKVKLTKDMLIERNMSGGENSTDLFSAEVVNASDPMGSKRGQRFLVPAGTEVFHPGGVADINEVVLKGFDFSEVEVNKGSLFAHDAPLLDYFKGRDNELDQQRNSDMRSREEARREAIKNGGAAGGIGAGMGGGFGAGEDEGGGGLIGWVMGNKGIATAITASGFALAMKSRFAKIAGKLFPKSKYGFVGPKQLRNPRLWPLILAAGVATAFIQAGDDVLSDPGDGQTGNGPDNQADAGVDIGGSSMVDNAITAAIWAPLLVKGAMKTRIGQGMAISLTKAYSKAAAGTPKNAIWKRMVAGGIGRLGGRAISMAFGPWGMAAYIAWGIIDWRMDVIKAQQEQGEEEIFKDGTMTNLDTLKDNYANRWKMPKFNVKGKKQWMLDNNPGYAAYLENEAIEAAASVGLLHESGNAREFSGRSDILTQNNDNKSFSETKTTNLYIQGYQLPPEGKRGYAPLGN